VEDFIKKVFKDQDSLQYTEFEDINLNETSEMFFFIIELLHKSIPCA